MRSLLLVRHAPTAATLSRVLPGDEPLDAHGKALARGLRGVFAPGAEAVSSPALRCRQTAHAAGLDARVDAALAECDFGAWAGRSLAELHAVDPDALSRWMTDPDTRPHGGESLRQLLARVARWLDAEAQRGDGQLVAITHGGPIKAALVHALGAAPDAFWRFEVEPLSLTNLHVHAGLLTVARVNCRAVPSNTCLTAAVAVSRPGGSAQA